MDRPLPIALTILMVATFLAGMVAIKMLVAPWIFTEYGPLGIVVWIIACLAAGFALED